MRARLTVRHAPLEVRSEDAPVHEIVRLGAEADLTSLPVHLQHALVGLPLRRGRGGEYLHLQLRSVRRIRMSH